MSQELEQPKADYTYWQNALRGEFGAVHDGDAQPGFWRKRTSKAGPFVPVAIWEQDGALVALVDGKIGDAAELWSYVCRHPTTEEAYRARIETGKWPDEDGAVAESLAPPPAGHNQGPTDEVEILRGQIEAASKNAADYVEITDEVTAAKAQGVRSRLLELRGDADKHREALVRPYLDAQSALNGIWMPLVKDAKAAADAIAKALSTFATRQANAAAEAARKTEEARIKAEREAVKAAAKGKPIPASAPLPPPPEPVQTQIKPSYGRAGSIKVIKVAKVIDQDAAYGAMKTQKELIELISKLAQRAADAGIPIAGVEVTEERKVV